MSDPKFSKKAWIEEATRLYKQNRVLDGIVRAVVAIDGKREFTKNQLELAGSVKVTFNDDKIQVIPVPEANREGTA